MTEVNKQSFQAQSGQHTQDMSLTIGKLAKQANVTLETIRYYQRKGLLQEPEKPVRGYRLYPSEAISRIRFIKRAQQTGFTLKEVSELLDLDSGKCDDVRQLAEKKRQQIDEQIQNLTALGQALDHLVQGCQNNPLTEQCSLIDAFSKDPVPNSHIIMPE